jgi:hypothetical protein
MTFSCKGQLVNTPKIIYPCRSRVCLVTER